METVAGGGKVPESLMLGDLIADLNTTATERQIAAVIERLNISADAKALLHDLSRITMQVGRAVASRSLNMKLWGEVDRMRCVGIAVFLLSASQANADFLKPSYYTDQCAELAFEVAYDHQKFVHDEFEYGPPMLVEYVDSSAILDASVILKEKRRFLGKKREFICGFNREGKLVDYSDPFEGGDVYVFDEPYVYNIVGDYVDIEDQGCSLISFSSDVAANIAGGAAVGAALGVSGGIIAIPVSGGILIAAGSGGGAIIGGGVGGLVGTAKAAYHCVAS